MVVKYIILLLSYKWNNSTERIQTILRIKKVNKLKSNQRNLKMNQSWILFVPQLTVLFFACVLFQLFCIVSYFFVGMA